MGRLHQRNNHLQRASRLVALAYRMVLRRDA
jgi:hypothetical protein